MSQNENDVQKEFFDSLQNFKEAVFNGQIRLALEHLVPVIDAIVDVLSTEPEPAHEQPTQSAAVNAGEPVETSKSSDKDDQKTKKSTADSTVESQA